MSDIADNRVIFHLLHSIGHNNVFISGGGDENIDLINHIFDSDNSVTFHTGL